MKNTSKNKLKECSAKDWHRTTGINLNVFILIFVKSQNQNKSVIKKNNKIN